MLFLIINIKKNFSYTYFFNISNDDKNKIEKKNNFNLIYNHKKGWNILY